MRRGFVSLQFFSGPGYQATDIATCDFGLESALSLAWALFRAVALLTCVQAVCPALRAPNASAASPMTNICDAGDSLEVEPEPGPSCKLRKTSTSPVRGSIEEAETFLNKDVLGRCPVHMS
jgi:hypothetical protein